MKALGRTRRVAAGAALSAAGLAMAGCGAGTAAVPTPGASIGTRFDQALPAQIRNLPLVTSAGKTLTLGELRGRLVVISDALSLCQETCPLDTATLVQTARAQNKTAAGKKIVYLTITVDPQRDTPAQLAAYRRLYEPAPANWYAVTGTPATINRLWRFFGVWHQKVPESPKTAPRNWRTGQRLAYDVDHSDEVFFLDKHGHERFVLEGPPQVSRGQIPSRLYRFMDKRGHQNVTAPPSTAWTESQAREVLTWLTTR